ncbi:MAG: Tol-Pal system beta propeller repeat protein TolB [candidate division KSB1 bacterium]|nr:Tol-Pal system beta propeller repeat protein TolB [candidate division KSB1 bacterium]
MKRNKFIPIFIAFLFFAVHGRAQKQVYMTITAEGFQPIVIAVPPFETDLYTEFADEVRQVVISDLTLSGFFYVVTNEDQTVTVPDGNGVMEVPLKPAVRLDAQLEVRNRAFTVKARLSDVPSRQPIFTKQYKEELPNKRQLAHECADDIVSYLTGEKGIAQSKIAFVKQTATGKEIAVMDYDGYGERLITRNRSLNLSPAWSPSLDKLVYTSYQTGNPDLFVYAFGSGRESKLSKSKSLNSAPAWSPDGKRIAFTLTTAGNADIWVMDADGGRLRQLTNSLAIDSSPSWSPNGREIAFTSDRSGNPQIYIMNDDGTNVRRLTFDGKYNDSPAWSPKGDLIAFVTRTDEGFQICTVDINGESFRQLTFSNGNNENPTWSPNGFKIAFSSNRSGGWDIYTMNRDGSQVRRVTVDGVNTSPKWSPR